MKAVPFRADSVSEMAETIAERIGAGFRPTLALVFASVAVGMEELHAALRQYDFAVAGCSSCGEILDCGEGGVVSSSGIVGFLLDIPHEAFRVGMFPAGESDDRETGREIARWGSANYPAPGYIVLGCGLERNGDELVAGVLEGAGGEVPLFGGLAGDDGHFLSSFAFDRGAIESRGALALALDTDRVSMAGLAVGGWVGIGACKQVTRARGNVVHSIGGQAALDIYMNYLDLREEDLPRSGVDYPLLLKTGRGTVLRAVMGVNRDERSLIFAGTVPEGALVQFSVCPGSEVIEATVEEVRLFREKHGDADALLLFSCMARHLSLGPEVEEEIHRSQALWGAPLLGFFTYGEIGPDGGGNGAFHNETFTLLALREIPA